MISDIALGFIVGALAVTTLSLSADRFGSKLAGAFGGFPATVGASLFFLGRSQGPVAASMAASVIPLMEGILGLFLAIFAFLSPRGLAQALITATATWVFLVCFPLFFVEVTMIQSLVILSLCFIVSVLVLESYIALPSAEGRVIDLSAADVVLRMLIGGSVVGLAIYLGKVLGPVAGGVMASFPAVVVSTLIVIQRSSGPNAAAAFAKALLFNALINAGVFSTVAHYSYVPFGVLGGTIIGFVASSISGLICWKLSSRRIK